MRIRTCLVLAISLFLCVFASLAQGAENITTTFLSLASEKFPEISFRARVVPPVPSPLGVQSFQVLENEAVIASCAITSEKPDLWYILTLERSSRIASAMPELTRSACAFIAAMPANAKLGIVSFGGDVTLNHAFSADRASLSKSVSTLQANGASALYDAIHKGCEAFQTGPGKNDIRTLILLTSGSDAALAGTTPQSAKTFDQAVALAQKYSVRIITIAFGGNVDDQQMKTLAQKTRGGFMKVPGPQAVFEICGKVLKRFELEQYFAFLYRTPHANRDGSVRHVKLTTTVKETTGHGMTQYTAPSDASAVSSTATDTSDVAGTEPAPTGDVAAQAGGVDGAATGDGPAPSVTIPTPRVNVHEIKDKLNQQQPDDGLGEGE